MYDQKKCSPISKKTIKNNTSCLNKDLLLKLQKILDVKHSNNIKILYNKLNDENTLDINWYKIFYELKNKNDDYIINHWKKNKKKNYGNNLELQIKTKCSGMRDFMIEHALERFFGYLNKYKNYIMLEI